MEEARQQEVLRFVDEINKDVEEVEKISDLNDQLQAAFKHATKYLCAENGQIENGHIKYDAFIKLLSPKCPTIIDFLKEAKKLTADFFEAIKDQPIENKCISLLVRMRTYDPNNQQDAICREWIRQFATHLYEKLSPAEKISVNIKRAALGSTVSSSASLGSSVSSAALAASGASAVQRDPFSLALDNITSISAITEDQFKKLMILIFSGQDEDEIVDRLEALLLKTDKNDTQKSIEETKLFYKNVNAHLGTLEGDQNQAFYVAAKKMFNICLNIRNTIALYGRNEKFDTDKKTTIEDNTTTKQEIMNDIDSAAITERQKQKLTEMLAQYHLQHRSVHRSHQQRWQLQGQVLCKEILGICC
jgi:hypothetical protein